MTDNNKSPEIAPGIAPERGDDVGWGSIPSVDEFGEPVVSPDELRVERESDPGPNKKGIAPQLPPKLIG